MSVGTLAELLLLAVEEVGQQHSSHRGLREEPQILVCSHSYPPLASLGVSEVVVALGWRHLTWLWDDQVTLGERLHQQIYRHQQAEAGL